VVLTSIGEIARQYWQAIPEHFQEVKLDEYHPDRLNVRKRKG
jgi:hypothetical protein